MILGLGLVPSSIDISRGGPSPTSVVGGNLFCCSRSFLITPLFNLSSCLFGSHCSASVVLTTEFVARTPLDELGVEEDSTLGFGSAEPGEGVSPSFCLTYDCIIGRESHLDIRKIDCQPYAFVNSYLSKLALRS